MEKTVLVIFKDELPKKNNKWWEQFNTVIASPKLEVSLRQYKLKFIDIESLLDSGSVQEASELIRKLSLLKIADGRRISKIVQYKGYELWWIHYDDLMLKFCLPYTQYSRLLKYLLNFSNMHLYQPQYPDLFKCFLSSHKCSYTITSKLSRRFPPGILLQVFLSIIFFMWLKTGRTRLMVWTSDLFDLPRDHDFRFRYIYEELGGKKISFVEFIRSMESGLIVIKHALKRKRPVIYSFAVSRFSYHLANLLSAKKYKNNLEGLIYSENLDSFQTFFFNIATFYLKHTSGDIGSITILRFIVRALKIKSSVIPLASSRNFHEVLACRLEGVKTFGILHGVASKDYNVYDFMPEFDGDKSLSLDKYGVWSEWWREYYIKNSKAYKPEQLYVSGPMRPLEITNTYNIQPAVGSQKDEGRIKVLFVPGELSHPEEIMPYLLNLMEAEGIEVYLTFRPYRDCFENWLKEHNSQVIEKLGKDKILLGNIHNAISKCDVVIGSYSTGALE
ncbi:hypothetical protein COU54_04835, partial [Candidatus Pacearchaeota archaeon CG10_big_fil_rev_8_21_14_0_10_31_24]